MTEAIADGHTQGQPQYMPVAQSRRPAPAPQSADASRLPGQALASFGLADTVWPRRGDVGRGKEVLFPARTNVD
jgi:hypothetical protein